jgi:hypothetical protein
MCYAEEEDSLGGRVVACAMHIKESPYEGACSVSLYLYYGFISVSSPFYVPHKRISKDKL